MHPIAFQIGDFAIYWYGILVATGFLAGIWTAARRGVRDGLARETLMDLGPWLIVGALVGARLVYVVSYWQRDFAGQPLTEIFKVRQGGFVFYGGFMGAAAAAIFYIRKKKLALWKVSDALAPSIALGHAFGRVGCLMTGCCYGTASHLPWAIHFPVDHYTHGIGVHPTQIYSSLANLALYGALAWLYRRKRFDGQIFGLYLICYSLIRAGLEHFRGDYPFSYLGGMFKPGQAFGVFVFIAGCALYLLRARAPSPQLERHPST